MMRMLTGALLASLTIAGCGRGSTDAARGSATASISTGAETDATLLAALEHDQFDDVVRATKTLMEKGDAATKRAAGPVVVRGAKYIDSAAWRDRNRPRLLEANKSGGIVATDAQVELQLDAYQSRGLADLLTAMAPIGTDEVMAYVLSKAEDAHATAEVRKAAVKALEAHPPSDPAMVTRVATVSAALSLEPDRSASPPDPNAPVPATKVSLGNAAVEGGDVTNAPPVVAGMAAGFRRCYKRALQDDPSIEGTVDLTAKLGANGEVTSVDHQIKGHLSDALVGCLSARVAAAAFDHPKKLPSSVSFSVTFALDR